MKRYLKYISIGLILFIGVFIVQLHVAHAITNPLDAITSLLGIDSLSNLITQFVANLANFALTTVAWILAGTGILLDTSINITLNIKDFVNATPVIFIVWQTIRDITGLFFIFFLLFAAFQMILGMGNKYGDTIKNIVIAGILINFSFFITSFLIDASNIISKTIYNQMVPTPAVSITANTKLEGLVNGFMNGPGGISSIFMQSFKIQDIYTSTGLSDPANQLQNQSVPARYIGAPLKIIMIAAVGIIIMVTAGISFVLASIAFIFRLVILLFLLAFSPLWFAAKVIPQLDQFTKPLWDYLKSQLLFMPAYLLFMYVALSILSKSTIFGVGYSPNIAAAVQGTSPAWGNGFIVLAINFALVIIVLNMPLVVALQLGGKATGFMKGWGADMIWKRVGNRARMTVTRDIGGRAASLVSKSETLRNFAASSKIGGLALKGVRAGASNYDAKLDKQVKERTQFADSLGYDQKKMNAEQANLRSWNAALASAQTAGLPTTGIKDAIRTSKNKITDIENERKAKAAKRTNTGSVGTLYTMVARKNKVAAAQMQKPIIEDKIARFKEDLKENKSDIKQLTQAINNNPAGIAGGVQMPAISATAIATPAQAAQMTSLLTAQVTHTANINREEALLDDLKLVK